MGVWDAWIGRELVEQDHLTPALVERFRATLDSDDIGDSAPQAIHWCLCPPKASTASLGADGHPARDNGRDNFLPPVPLPRRMWASGSVEFVRPLTVGTAVTRRSRIAEIAQKQGGTGRLVFVEIDHEMHMDGALVINERQTIVYREASRNPPTPKPADVTVDLSAWHWHRMLTPSAPMLFRYSALTFNSHRIHYDLPYACDVEGYRGLVVHGPLLATLLLDLAARELGSNRLKHFAHRAHSPAFAGEALHLAGRREGDRITLAVLGGDSRTVMSAEARL